MKATDGVLLLGGAAVSHFRIRVAQSHARDDMTPSSWSLTGILLDGTKFLSVPLDLCGDASEIAKGNGVQTCNMSDYTIRSVSQISRCFVLRVITTRYP